MQIQNFERFFVIGRSCIVDILALVPISMLFYFLDRHWYHRLLQGAVAQCIEIENKYADELPETVTGRKFYAQTVKNYLTRSVCPLA